MVALLLPFGICLGLCLAITPAARALAARFGLTDKPDGHRKIHTRVIPLAGGIALLVSCSITLMVAMWAANPWQEILESNGGWLPGLFLASLIICGVGLVDDGWGLRVWAKLLGQLAAISVVIHSGLVVRNIGVFELDIELGMFAVPFTVLWLLGTINSLNLLDGMDGMLCCLGLVISAGMAIMAALLGQWTAACVAATLAGGLLGFLRYNFPPASVFLGDSGSMLIGLAVGVLAMQGSLKGPATIGLAVPVAVLTLPIFDTAAAIIRRKLRGLGFSTPDRGHLHHCLLRRGFSNRVVLLWVSVFSLVTGIGALASLAFKNELFAVLTGLIVVGFLIATRLFGYAEFILVRDRVMARVGSLWHGPVNGKSHGAAFPGDGPEEWKELWESLTASAPELNLRVIRLDIKGETILGGYHVQWNLPDDQEAQSGQWRAEFPLKIMGRNAGRLEVVGQPDDDPIWGKMATLAEMVENFEKREASREASVSEAGGFDLGARSFAPNPGPAFTD